MMDTIDCGILIKILFWLESFYRLKSEVQYNNINHKSEINQLKMLAKDGRGVCMGLCLYVCVCVCVCKYYSIHPKWRDALSVSVHPKKSVLL